MRKKLIEVAPFLPLDAISTASKADKDKKTGTIKNVHKWFAPMPTPALRALIFAALVEAPDDETERDRLLDLVKRLVPSDGNPPSAAVLEEATAEIRRSCGDHLPTVFDPFCGGGSTLIEAQRLGLPAMGSDLNPVPVLITRTMTELIPQVAGRPPLVHDPKQLSSMTGGRLDGLLSDVRHYADAVRQEVWDEVGHLYPEGPNGETIIAWLWAWTVTCPNPACGARMPLVSNLWLSKKSGAERWLDLDTTNGQVTIAVAGPDGQPGEDLKLPGNRPKFWCARCRVGIAEEAYLREEGLAGRFTLTPLVTALVDRKGRRSFVPFAEVPEPDEPGPSIDVPITENSRWFSPPSYGFRTYEDLYLPRQLVMLEAFARAVAGVPERVAADGGDEIYARTITSILGLALGKLAQSNSTQARWYIGGDSGSNRVQAAFGRHALPMVWDFVELNPFSDRAANWLGVVRSLLTGITSLPRQGKPAHVVQADARARAADVPAPALIVTDPPYFDQIGYADLSDYFYVWHRMALRRVHPDLYGTITTPKDAELIATPYRHGGSKEVAAQKFVEGFTETFRSLRDAANGTFPILIVYAHRQEETSSLGTASTGWDAMLEAVLGADLTIEGTLPVRGTGSSRQIGQGTNALASYIVMVCRPRPADRSPATLAEFRTALRQKLPPAVRKLLDSGESMVDIRHAAIGPGMEVFSLFSRVFDGNKPIKVRRALTIINEELGRLLDESLGAVDDETRWACQWYSDHAFEPWLYEDALKLAASFGLGVDGLVRSGIVQAGRGEARLVPRGELAPAWAGDDRTSVWEACQHLTKRLTDGRSASEEAAGALLAQLGPKATGARELAYYLTNLAIEKGWTDEAIAYDALVKSWPRIEEIASDPALQPGSGQLFAL